MRFAHIADTHLGYRQYNLDEREEDFYSAFHEAVDKIIGAKVDFVVHVGDLFEEPRPPVRAMVEVRNALDKLDEEDIPVFAIAGNHDILMRRGAVPPQKLYKDIGFLTINEPWREFDGIFIGGLPYHSKIHINALKERLKTITKEAEGYEKKILMLHQGIKKYFPLEFELTLEDVPKGFDYYALGHLHMRIVDDLLGGKLVYPGSTEIWRIDELKDYEMNGKGFYVVDAEDFDLERFDLEDIRPFVRREVTSEDLKIREIEEALRDEKKPVVNLTVISDIHDYPWVYQKLVDELKGALYLDIKRRWTAEGEEVFSDRIINIRELIDDAMNDYSTMERDYAYTVFKSLSSGNLDEALAVTEEFYKVWREEGEKEREIVRLEAQKKVEKPDQSTLEVFR